MFVNVPVFWKRASDVARDRISSATIWILVAGGLLALVGLGPWLLNHW
jgi:hypothetical protein